MDKQPALQPDRPRHRHRPSRTSRVLLSLLAAFLLFLYLYPARHPHPPPAPSPDATIRALLAQLTLPEKVNLTTGVGWMNGPCVGNTGSVPRLGIPSLCLHDGPLGLRFLGQATAFPAGITAGSTWNRDLLFRRGLALGREARRKGISVLLGPSVGPLGRSPLAGRAWEGFGPDPVLQGVAGAETVRGIQAAGVVATVKHLVGNEQEHFRRGGDEWSAAPAGWTDAVDVRLDEATLREVYLWPFHDAVRAGAGAAMCAYNRFRGEYACESAGLLAGLLKRDLGFAGFVVSDWRAQTTTAASALAGLDMSMPGESLPSLPAGVSPLWGRTLTESVLNGSVPLSRLDDMVARILHAVHTIVGTTIAEPTFSSWTDQPDGWIHAGSPDRHWGPVNRFVDVRSDHAELARQVAEEGTVLLKNDGLLPLRCPDGGDGARQQKIAVFGHAASLRNRPAHCPDGACTGGPLLMGWGSGSAELNMTTILDPLDALRQQLGPDRVDYHLDMPAAAAAAAAADLSRYSACVVFLSSSSGEGYLAVDGVRGDRDSLAPDGLALLDAVSRQCRRTAAVVYSVGPVVIPPATLARTAGLVLANLPGEAPSAAVDVLTGRVNPSGKLAYTLARRERDYGPSLPIHTRPGVPQRFAERDRFDYRHFDEAGIAPAFEFGFGLSYTSFAAGPVRLEVDPAERAVRAARIVRARPPATTPSALPAPEECAPPKGFRLLRDYIYPWLSDEQLGRLSGRPPRPPAAAAASTDTASDGAVVDDSHLFAPVAKLAGTVTNTGDRAGKAVVQVYVRRPGPAAENGTAPMAANVLRNFVKTPSLRPGEEHPFELELTRRDLSSWEPAADGQAEGWVLSEKDIEVSVRFSSRDVVWTGHI